jgi:hypothetical protein
MIFSVKTKESGSAWVGQKVNDFFSQNKRIIQLEFASKIKYGLEIGSSDLIGWEYIQGNPVICSVEVKTKKYKKFSKQQKDWLNNIKAIGGRAYVAMENNNGYDLKEWEVQW